MTEPNWPTEADMNDLADDLLGIVLPEGSGARLLTRALELWGRPAIKPVPVSERPWEREKGWSDPDGECWWCPPDGPPYWQMANPAMVYGGWLLPHYAMPVPSSPTNE